MKVHDVSRTINATPEAIWAILADGPSWPEWDPGLDRIEGRIALGEKIKVVTKLSPDRTFPVEVTEFEPARRMAWSGGMPLGLFKGVRTFTLSPRDEGATDFRMREEFSGPLLPLIGRSMPDLQPAFEQFGDGLKQRAERA